MGSELCMVWLICDKDMKPNWKAGHKVIDSLEKNHLGQIEGSGGMGHAPDNLHASLKYLEDSCTNGDSSATTIEVGHLNIWITGGESWGDDPNQLYTEICALDDVDIDILRSVGYHQQEDVLNYKAIVMKILRNKQIIPLLIGVDKELDKLITPKLKGKK